MAKNQKKGSKPKKKDPLQAKKDSIDLAIVGIGIVVGLIVGMIVFTAMNPGSEEKAVAVTYDIEGGGIKESVSVGLRCDDLLTGIEATKGMKFDGDTLVTVNEHKAEELGGTHWTVSVNGEDVTDKLETVPVTEGMVVFFKLVLE